MTGRRRTLPRPVLPGRADRKDARRASGRKKAAGVILLSTVLVCCSLLPGCSARHTAASVREAAAETAARAQISSVRLDVGTELRLTVGDLYPCTVTVNIEEENVFRQISLSSSDPSVVSVYLNGDTVGRSADVMIVAQAEGVAYVAARADNGVRSERVKVIVTAASAATAAETSAAEAETAPETTASGSETEAAAEETASPEKTIGAADADPNVQTYILNTNSGKFHHPWCESVSKMKEKNKKEVEDTRDNILAQGYVPCKNCDP